MLENVISYVFGLKEHAKQIPAPSALEKKTIGKETDDLETRGSEKASENRTAQDGAEEYVVPGEREELDMLRNTIIAVTHKIYLDQWIEKYAAEQQKG